jgi:radical SAM superfamily enzyme YgiQ (UPF0313 family)
MYDINLVMPQASLGKNDYEVPLGISYLRATLRDDGFNVNTQDLSFQKINWNTKVLGVSFTTFGFGEAKKLVERAKERGIVTVAGGTHAKVDAQSCLDIGFDYVFKGEAETKLSEILQKIIDEKQEDKIVVGEPANLNNIPLPDFSWITGECRYTTGMPFNTSRGCPHRCTFCSKVHGSKWRAMSVERMLENYTYLSQLKLLKNRGIYIVDDTFSTSHKRLAEFDALLKKERTDKRPLLLRNGIRIDHINDEMMKTLLSIGVTNMVLGVETTDDLVLKMCKKGITFSDIENAIKTIKRFGFGHGGNTAFFLIMGLPHSTFNSDIQTMRWLTNTCSAYQSWAIATAIPQSEMFEWIHKNGRWLVDYNNYEEYAGFSSKGIVMFDTEDYPKEKRELAWKILKGEGVISVPNLFM